MAGTIRTVIVDDHALVRGGLKLFIDSVEDLELVGQAANGREAIQVCEETEPDVVLMDLIMPNMDGVEAIKVIHAAHPKIRIIALTSFKEDELVYRALKAGAVNFLSKDVSYDELMRAIRDAYYGQATTNSNVTAALVRMADRTATPTFQLGIRELEVLRLIAHGQSNPEIAKALHLSGSTVKFHVSNVLSKLGVTSRAQAAALAVQLKLVE